MRYSPDIRRSPWRASPEESKLRTPEYLDLLRATLHLPSDYALQKPLGISKSLVSAYRTGKESLSDSLAVKVAALCNLPAERVLVDAQIEKAKTPEEQAAWRSVMEKISGSFNALRSGGWLGAERRRDYVSRLAFTH